MALLLSAVSALNGTFTAPNGVGDGYCSNFYGTWPKRMDCARAIRGLESGSSLVDYTVHTGYKHNLPFHVEYGSCMIQVELAGPRLPTTFEFIPNDIIEMAQRIQGECVQGSTYFGGFMTSDMAVLKSWIVSAESELSKPFPTSTAFITVSISNPVPDWLSPGNYDPVIAENLAEVEFNAIKSAIPGTKLAADLLARGNRLLKQAVQMEPRGHRIPWWNNPFNAEHRNETQPVELVGPAANITDTASSTRRRRF